MSGDLTTPEFWDDLSRSGRKPPSNNWTRWMRDQVVWIQRYSMLQKMGQFIDAVGKPQADILEIGCAPGITLEHIHRLRPQHRLHGLDYAEKSVEITRQRLWSLGIEADVHYGDVRDFEPSRNYDLVLSLGLIEHFEDPVPLLRHHARLAVPGGLVVVIVPNYAASVVRALIQRFDPEALVTHNLAIMSEPALRGALQQAELQQIQVGSVGGPRLRSACNPLDFYGRMYRLATRMWNLSIALLPLGGLGWRSWIWGLGHRGTTERLQY